MFLSRHFEGRMAMKHGCLGCRWHEAEMSKLARHGGNLSESIDVTASGEI